MRRTLVATCLTLLTGCASAPVALTDLPGNPARADAPDAATPPLEPYLMPDVQPTPTPLPTPTETTEIYTCSMHQHVEETLPGACPVCGMALVPKKEHQ